MGRNKFGFFGFMLYFCSYISLVLLLLSLIRVDPFDTKVQTSFIMVMTLRAKAKTDADPVLFSGLA